MRLTSAGLPHCEPARLGNYEMSCRISRLNSPRRTICSDTGPSHHTASQQSNLPGTSHREAVALSEIACRMRPHSQYLKRQVPSTATLNDTL